MVRKKSSQVTFEIDGRPIGKNHEPYFVAEVASNHQQCIEQARALIKYAKNSGADAIKFQTFTADTLTLPIRNKQFEVNGPKHIKYFYDLYQLTSIPWEWHEDLYNYAKQIGITLFSTPYDETSVDFLEKTIFPPVYRISSFELTHLPLLKKVASTGKPVILGTGLATVKEIKEAIQTLQKNGCTQWMLLKNDCTRPSNLSCINLRSINELKRKFSCPVGFSDHSNVVNMVFGSIAFGACLIEKHFKLSHSAGALDENFSLDPKEFRAMVDASKELYRAFGEREIGPMPQEMNQLRNRRSIYVSKPIKKGEYFSKDNLKIIRPAFGLAPKYWEKVLGKKAATDLVPGTPLSLEYIASRR